ncbi:MAG TPA: outer membrane beta-barrel protein [Flavisolibacter sp.]|nr:outer membrane beta-barrel protein [Flavisolibacter sp.]
MSVKSLLLCALLGASVTSYCQNTPDFNAQAEAYQKMAKEMKPKLGIKVGYNSAYITGSTPSFKPEAKNGFTVAGFYSPASRTGRGYRTELIFSRQGFAFDAGGKLEQVTNDYIYMPHFTTFGIGKFFQLQIGAQIGYLLHASKKEESGSSSSGSDITSLYNRLDYGAAGGFEIYPYKGLILGARYNLSFGSLYKYQQQQAGQPNPFPLPFNPEDVKNKNAVVNFFLGYKF